MAEPKSVGIVGAGIFGLSLAVALSSKTGYNVTVFDRYKYDESGYAPGFDDKVQAASVDHNKIFRASYGSKIHYQRLAVESRQSWEKINASLDASEVAERGPLFNACGMLRVQSADHLDDLERETLANMERDGLRQTQFARGVEADRQRARDLGWDAKVLDFGMPDESPRKSFEAVLDSLAGFIRCSDACNYFYKKAAAQGVTFCFGPDKGAFECLVEERVEERVGEKGQKKATGLKTKDGTTHKFDVVVIAAGSFSTQLLPELAYHLESSAGSLATFKIDRQDTALWDKYSPERFPVITWKGSARNKGADAGSIYVLPRTPEGLVKIGFRGKKFTNFQPAPDSASFNQHGLWSVPLSPAESLGIQEDASREIKHFVSIFLPDFDGKEFYATKMCWYTDTLDNSFLIDYVPTYADKSVFVCTGGSGHGAKFLPVLGKHAADILEHGEQSSSYMGSHWQWRDHVGRENGLEEGPGGARNIGKAAP